MDINECQRSKLRHHPDGNPRPGTTTSAMLLSGLGVAFGVAFRRRASAGPEHWLVIL